MDQDSNFFNSTYLPTCLPCRARGDCRWQMILEMLSHIIIWTLSFIYQWMGDEWMGDQVDGRLVDGRPVDWRPMNGRPLGGRPVDGRPVDGLLKICNSQLRDLKVAQGNLCTHLHTYIANYPVISVCIYVPSCAIDPPNVASRNKAPPC